MGQYLDLYKNAGTFISLNRKPDFNNLLKVLKREKPDRPTLFEFFLNDELYKKLTCNITYDETDEFFKLKRTLDAYSIMGYDYVTLHGSDFALYSDRRQDATKASISLNDGAVIFDRESFEKYRWADPADYDYSRLVKLGEYMPEGMNLIVYGNGGILENVISLVGYENLCYLIMDDPELVTEIFAHVGTRFVKYYEICSGYDSVGALISNDDWGFNSQTMLSVEDMKKYVIPWHKKIAETIHRSGKPAILHSCGRLTDVMDDIIDDIKYDAKHSYEDKIIPVEEAYETYGSRIAIFGGLDVNFVCSATPEQIYNRASSILRQTGSKGGYALGSGNSIPYYVPDENYFAMAAAALFE